MPYFKRRLAALLLVLCLAGGTGSPAQGAQEAARSVPILMYHRVSTSQGALGKFVITPQEFERDLQYLQAHGYRTITMSDLVRFVHSDGELPEKPIVLTFDDGYHSDYRFVFPLLQQYDAKAVFSVIGEVTDLYSQVSGNVRQPHLTWAQIQEMQESGLAEFQNHSYGMHKDGKGAARRKGETDEEYKARLTEDLLRWQARFPEMSLPKPTTFTYPYGAVGKGSQETLREMNFLVSLSCYERVSVLTRGDPACLFQLGRVVRPHGPSSEQVLNKIEALMQKTAFRPLENSD